MDGLLQFTSVVIGDETLSCASDIGSTSIDVISMRTELDDNCTMFDLKGYSLMGNSAKRVKSFMLIILVCQSLWRVMKRVC